KVKDLKNQVWRGGRESEWDDGFEGAERVEVIGEKSRDKGKEHEGSEKPKEKETKEDGNLEEDDIDKEEEEEKGEKGTE
ncbi:hypothetical protein, partial [Escherichia coli]|uniref:hypothetical protein n=1 Tax=Escherichia coli TaxID=562 RepID=UPI001C5906E7